jgi:hypothetical protein
MNFRRVLFSGSIFLFLGFTVLAGVKTDYSSFLVKYLGQTTNFKEVQKVFVLHKGDDLLLGRFLYNENEFYIYYEKTRPKSGSLSVVVIFDNSKKIVDLFFPESTGYNNRLSNRRFRRSLTGKEPAKKPLRLGRDHIDAVSGATLSSQIVVDTANKAGELISKFY